MHGRWCHAAAASNVSWVKSAVCCRRSTVCRGWHHLPELKRSGILSLIWNTHMHTRAQVCGRWGRLIASALHHEWQQEVMNVLLYGGRGNEYVGYLSLCLKPFPIAQSLFLVPARSLAFLHDWNPIFAPICCLEYDSQFYWCIFIMFFFHLCPTLTQSIALLIYVFSPRETFYIDIFFSSSFSTGLYPPRPPKKLHAMQGSNCALVEYCITIIPRWRFKWQFTIFMIDIQRCQLD